MAEVIRTKIRGVSRKKRQETIQNLYEGALLDLRREPYNDYDPNAIRIFEDEYSDDDIGYISAELAEKLAPIMDKDSQLIIAEVANITGEDKQTQGVNILITVYSEDETEEIRQRTRERFAINQEKAIHEKTIKPEPTIVDEPAFKYKPVTLPQSFELPKKQAAKKKKNRSDKNIVVVFLLWLCLGPLGGHRAYVGRWSWLYALTFGYLGFGWIYDLFLIVFASFKDRYGRVIWF